MTFGKTVLAVCAGVLLAGLVAVIALWVLSGAERAAARQGATAIVEKQQKSDRLKRAAELACSEAAEKELAAEGAVNVDQFSLELFSTSSGPAMEGKAFVTPPAGGTARTVRFSCRFDFDGDAATVTRVSVQR